MIHLFVNFLAASAGGGLTYVRNVIPQFARRTDLRVTAALSPDARRELAAASNIEFLELELPSVARFWYEQRVLPELTRKSGANVLLSAGNFALRYSPVPQILLSRNSLYLSRDFFRDLRSRREYRMLLATRMRALLAKRSVHWADVTVAPSQAFATELERWTGAKIVALHHGFDKDTFARDCSPLPEQAQLRLDAVADCLKILFVSHYNYYRNFETLIHALPLLRHRLAGRKACLLLTCHLAPGLNPGTYKPDYAKQLIRDLAVSEMVVELGPIPYHQLHHVYAQADIYATAAYAETFAHPLVEAMATGVPVVASDIPVHREICGDGALYFERFSPEALVESILQITSENKVRRSIVERGTTRAGQFSWKVHVDQIIELSRLLLE